MTERHEEPGHCHWPVGNWVDPDWDGPERERADKLLKRIAGIIDFPERADDVRRMIREYERLTGHMPPGVDVSLFL